MVKCQFFFGAIISWISKVTRSRCRLVDDPGGFEKCVRGSPRHKHLQNKTGRFLQYIYIHIHIHIHMHTIYIHIYIYMIYVITCICGPSASTVHFLAHPNEFVDQTIAGFSPRFEGEECAIKTCQRLPVS